MQQITWKQFRTHYESEGIGSLAIKTQDQWYRVADLFERVAKPKDFADVDRIQLIKFADYMRKLKLSQATSDVYMSKIKAAIKWGYDRGLIETMPVYKSQKIVGNGKAEPSRSVTDAELDRILECVPLVRRQDAPLWIRLLKGANQADLRMSELLELSWNPASRVRLMVFDGRPLVHFTNSRIQRGQKNGKVEVHPVGPEFWRIVTHDCDGNELPQDGYAFPMLGFEHPDIQMSRGNVDKMLRTIAELAGVVTEDLSGKLASMHDIGRKVYIRRLLENPNISDHELRKLVRHSSLKTTIRHYGHMEAKSLGRHLGWND